jgi:amino acid transporter
MQFAFMICLMFTLGDLDKVENSPTGLPIIEVYYQATKSKQGANVLVVIIALILFISLFNGFASVSRLTWAFARGKGPPSSSLFSYVSTHVHQWPLFRDRLNSVAIDSSKAGNPAERTQFSGRDLRLPVA